MREKIFNLLEAISKGLHERDDIVAKTLLATIAGQSVFLYGPPGTAKSLIARRINLAFKDAAYFEYLMQKFSTPDEVFGPIDIKSLKEGKYVRNTQGYLPSANFAFLDEIFKSSPAILNTLLTIINEKLFKNGNENVRVPLYTLITASNETPDIGSGLEALYDRLNMRLFVEPLQDWNNFVKLISDENDEPHIDENLKITVEELDVLRQKAKNIKFSYQSLEIIKLIKLKLNDLSNPIYISDRRYKNLAQILKIAAILSDRDEILPIDTFILADCLWNNKDEIKEVKRIVKESVYTVVCPDIDYTFLDEFNEIYKTFYELFFYQDDIYKTKIVNDKICYEFELLINRFNDENDKVNVKFYIPIDEHKGIKNPLDAGGQPQRRLVYAYHDGNFKVGIDRGAYECGWDSGAAYNDHTSIVRTFCPTILHKKGDMIAIKDSKRKQLMNISKTILKKMDQMIAGTNSELTSIRTNGYMFLAKDEIDSFIQVNISLLNKQKHIRLKISRFIKDLQGHKIA